MIYPAVGGWSRDVLDRAGSHGSLSRTDLTQSGEGFVIDEFIEIERW